MKSGVKKVKYTLLGFKIRRIQIYPKHIHIEYDKDRIFKDMKEIEIYRKELIKQLPIGSYPYFVIVSKTKTLKK